MVGFLMVSRSLIIYMFKNGEGYFFFLNLNKNMMIGKTNSSSQENK